MNDPDSDELSAGWYPDLNEPGMERYWMGKGWSRRTRPVQPIVALPVQAIAAAVGAVVSLALWLLLVR